MGEARMDVIESEIAYLGYHASESYGLVWKVCFVSRNSGYDRVLRYPTQPYPILSFRI